MATSARERDGVVAAGLGVLGLDYAAGVGVGAGPAGDRARRGGAGRAGDDWPISLPLPRCNIAAQVIRTAEVGAPTVVTHCAWSSPVRVPDASVTGSVKTIRSPCELDRGDAVREFRTPGVGRALLSSWRIRSRARESAPKRWTARRRRRGRSRRRRGEQRRGTAPGRRTGAGCGGSALRGRRIGRRQPPRRASRGDRGGRPGSAGKLGPRRGRGPPGGAGDVPRVDRDAGSACWRHRSHRPEEVTHMSTVTAVLPKPDVLPLGAAPRAARDPRRDPRLGPPARRLLDRHAARRRGRGARGPRCPTRSPGPLDGHRRDRPGRGRDPVHRGWPVAG